MALSRQKPGATPDTSALHTLELTSPARKVWETLPDPSRRELLNSVACFSCADTKGLGSQVNGRVSKGKLRLHGKCNRCGAEAVRIVDNR